MSFTFRPIPLHYRGIQFRTQTAVRWARALDCIGVHWQHEPMSLLPMAAAVVDTFWLTASCQRGVVMPALTALDRLTVVRWTATRAPRIENEDGYDDYPAMPDIPIVTLGEAGRFSGWNRATARGFAPDAVQPEANVALCRCIVCGGWWFCAAWHSWACQCCGHYDGNADVSPMLESPLTGWPTPPRYALDEEAA